MEIPIYGNWQRIDQFNFNQHVFTNITIYNIVIRLISVYALLKLRKPYMRLPYS